MKYLNIKKALAAWQELQPLSDKDRERLSRRFTVDFNYNSNHIEGNTLTYGQTEILLLFGKVIGEADVRDVQEMAASNVGLRMMTEEARVKEIPLTQNFIRTQDIETGTVDYNQIYNCQLDSLEKNLEGVQ